MRGMQLTLPGLSHALRISAAFESALAIFSAENALAAKADQVRRNAAIVRAFWLAAGEPELHTIDRQTILGYLMDHRLRISPKTLRNHLSTVGLFCDWLQKRGVLAYNPARGLRLARLRKELPCWLRDEEMALALAAARASGVEIEVLVALHTGLRMTELRMMRWEQIDFQSRLLDVPSYKSIQPRKIPLNTTTLEALRRQRTLTGSTGWVFAGRGPRGVGLRDAPRGIDWWSHALDAVRRAVPSLHRRLLYQKGRTGNAWHALRHTFATRLAGRVDIYKIKNWLGHASVKTTEIYAHLAEEWDPDIEKLL